ncbi:HET-domain-containing protein [Biscogniauxia mediterranea]|nr:HET-domain-containing protein [Biscogniauxia mediterranea]
MSKPVKTRDQWKPGSIQSSELAKDYLEPQRSPAYPYRNLGDNDIRLLKIVPGKYDDQIECLLDQVPLDSSPHFYSLSYVWGNASKTMPILLEGRPFDITINLYAALHQMRALDNEMEYLYTYIWVDAICINQQDVEEKSRQVPRISDIYAESIQVIIWLGPNGPAANRLRKRVSQKADLVWYSDMSPSRFFQGAWSTRHKPSKDATISQLFQAAEEYWKQFIYSEEDERTILRKVLGHSRSLVDHGVLTLLNKPWFLRAWTLQEPCLNSLDPLVQAGRHAIELNRLHAFLRAYMEEYRHISLTKGLLRLVGLFQIREECRRQRVKLEDPTRKGKTPSEEIANCLMRILELAGDKESTDPVDQIYGILGLVRACTGRQLPPELTPDYGIPYETVYWNYGTFILEHCGDLRILNCRQQKLSNTPSWVPDFRHLRVRASHRRHTHPISISPDKRELKLQGQKLGALLDYIDGCSLDAIEPDKLHIPEAFARRLKLIQDKILSRSSELRKTAQEEILNTWMGCTRRLFAGELETFWQAYCRLMTSPGPAKRPRTVTDSEMYEIHSRELVIAFESSNPIILLEDGSIIRVQRTDVQVEPGDVLCSFKGSKLPSLVRPSGEKYVFLSQCEVRSGTLESQEFGDDFWAETEARSFVLV